MFDFARMLRLAAIDKALIVLFCIYAVWLIFVIFRSKQRRRDVRIDLEAVAATITALFRCEDNEPFDPSWMDAKKWMESRR